MRAVSEYDDVQNALTNLSVMGNDENGESEILFDAQAFEKPPDGTTLGDLRMPQHNLEQYLQIAAELRAGYGALAKDLELHEAVPNAGADDEDAKVCDELQQAFNARESGKAEEDFALNTGYQ